MGVCVGRKKKDQSTTGGGGGGVALEMKVHRGSTGNDILFSVLVENFVGL